MITACHNRYLDDGLKIAGLNGEPISSDWKKFYNEIANKPILSEFIIDYIYNLFNKNKIIIDFNIQSSICFALDTRPSSKNIFKVIK